jgi:hypothetical protein
VEQAPKLKRSTMFSIRVWREELGSDQWELRGKVLHLHSGEAAYFRDWETLIGFLETKTLSFTDKSDIDLLQYRDYDDQP